MRGWMRRLWRGERSGRRAGAAGEQPAATGHPPMTTAPQSLAALAAQHGPGYRWRVLMTVMIGSIAQHLVRDPALHARLRADRALIEPHLAPQFTFFSPADPGIDRDRYFERCWPNADLLRSFRFVRLLERDDEVIVTYEAEKQAVLKVMARVDGNIAKASELLSTKTEVSLAASSGVTSDARTRRRDTSLVDGSEVSPCRWAMR